MAPPSQSTRARTASRMISSTRSRSRAGPISRVTRAMMVCTSSRRSYRSAGGDERVIPPTLSADPGPISMDRADGSCHGHPVPPALVLDAVRTPLGRLDGVLAAWHPADLLAAVLVSLAARTGVDPAAIDDVVVGCAMTVGSQGFNVARNA